MRFLRISCATCDDCIHQLRLSPKRVETRGEIVMLAWAFIFLIIAIIAAIVGYTGVFAAAAGIAKVLFFIFIILAIIAFITTLFRRQQ